MYTHRLRIRVDEVSLLVTPMNLTIDEPSNIERVLVRLRWAGVVLIADRRSTGGSFTCTILARPCVRRLAWLAPCTGEAGRQTVDSDRATGAQTDRRRTTQTR